MGVEQAAGNEEIIHKYSPEPELLSDDANGENHTIPAPEPELRSDDANGGNNPIPTPEPELRPSDESKPGGHHSRWQSKGSYAVMFGLLLVGSLVALCHHLFIPTSIIAKLRMFDFPNPGSSESVTQSHLRSKLHSFPLLVWRMLKDFGFSFVGRTSKSDLSMQCSVSCRILYYS
jgi:hypothetical protein